MYPPTKDQTSIGVDNPTVDASDGALIDDGHTIYENKDTARQEFAQEADINHMLSRFQIVPERGAPAYGEWDDSITLQTALDNTREARSAYSRLPKELTDKFRSMEELLRAVENGTLTIKDETTATTTDSSTSSETPK